MARCAVGVTEGRTVEAGLHQRSSLSPLLFAKVTDRLTDADRQESLWTVMFPDDIVKCTVGREPLMETPQRWQNRTLVSEWRGAEWNGVATGSGDKESGGDFKYRESTVQINSTRCSEEHVPGGWKELTQVSGIMCNKKNKMKGVENNGLKRGTQLEGSQYKLSRPGWAGSVRTSEV